jgi:hypothetical protein
MMRIIGTFVVSAILLITGITHAENTYEDLNGRFVIDLPNGWELQPQTDDRVHVFKGDGNSIIITFYSGNNNTEELFNETISDLRDGGIENPIPEGKVKDMKVNGNNARWGIYKGEFDAGSVKVILFSSLGSVSLKENGVNFMSIMNSGTFEKWHKRLEKVFHSIRNVGQDVTGISEVSDAIVDITEDRTTAGPTIWEHDLAKLTLPSGWQEIPISSGSEKEVIGNFKYNPLGSTMFAVAYRGFGMDKGKVLKAAMQTVQIAMPDAEPIKVYELENGEKISIVVYEGTVVDRGTEIPMAAVTATVKAKKCYLNLIGITLHKHTERFEQQIATIAQSAD